MTFAVTPLALLSVPVENAGTFVLRYPSGFTVSSPWDGAGHVLVDDRGNVHTSGFTVSFGASLITVTNTSLGTLPAGLSVRLQGSWTALDAHEAVGVAAAALAAHVAAVNPHPAVAVTLTDAATINWNAALGKVATVTLGGNRTIAAPSNLAVGLYTLHVIQDGTGTRVPTWSTVFKWSSGQAPTLSTRAGARDVFRFESDGTYLYGEMMRDVRGFLPSNLNDTTGIILEAWFKKGTAVTGNWPDATEYGRNLQLFNTPTISATSVLFNGTNQRGKTAAFTFNQPLLMGMRVKQVTWTGNDYLCDGNVIATMGLQQTNAGTPPQLSMYAGAVVGPNAALPVGTFGALLAGYNGASSFLRANSTTVTGDVGAGNAGGFSLACLADLSSFANIEVEEIVLVSGMPSAANLDLLATYLQSL
jgi:hypothetical protein